MTTTKEDLIRMSNEVLDEMLPEELALLAEDAIAPGDKPGDVVNKPSAENPLPMAMGEMETAGYVYVYDKLTGERSLCNKNMLVSQIRKTNDAGEYIFITYPPKNPDGTLLKPWRGSTLCMLHPDGPDRKEYDRMGLPVCHSAKLASEYEMESHMKGKHKREWGAIEDIRTRIVDEEERQVRHALINANVSASVQDAPLKSVAAPIEPEVPVYVDSLAPGKVVIGEVDTSTQPIPSFVIETEVESPALKACDECDYTPPPAYKKGERKGQIMSEKQLAHAVVMHKKSNH